MTAFEAARRAAAARCIGTSVVARVLVAVLAVAGCAPLGHNTALTRVPARDDVAAYPTTPLRWHLGPRCADRFPAAARNRQDLAAACEPDPRGHDFVAVAISGGGAKAATFGGEALFLLQALGLLQHADVVSGVSGGSFAATLYALSCDRSDTACREAPGRQARPVWDYAESMERLSRGYLALLAEFVGRAVVPILPTAIPNGRFAGFIDRTYLAAEQGGGAGFTFADLNPRRPHLFVNSAIVSGHRFVVDEVAPCRPVAQRSTEGGRGFLRRRSADEFAHFSFTDFYFRRLCSDITTYPLARAVAASAAFPALIEYAKLEDHGAGRGHALLLTDGGANDNQGLTEIYMHLAEALAGQRRSEPRAGEQLGGRTEMFGRRDRGLYFVINTSMTDTMGVDDVPGYAPSLVSFLFSTAGRVSSAFDRASAANFSLRSRLYLRELLLAQQHFEKANGWSGWAAEERIRVQEIGLSALDEYPLGGAAAALRQERGVWPPHPSEYDPDQQRIARQIVRQRSAFESLQTPLARDRLGLSDIHPQCLFERSKEAERSIFSLAYLDGETSVCLRHAARWSAALRAQELCNDLHRGEQPLNDTRHFREACVAGKLALLPNHANDRLAEACALGDLQAEEGPGRVLVELRQRERSTPPRDRHLLPDAQCRIRPAP